MKRLQKLVATVSVTLSLLALAYQTGEPALATPSSVNMSLKSVAAISSQKSGPSVPIADILRPVYTPLSNAVPTYAVPTAPVTQIVSIADILRSPYGAPSYELSPARGMQVVSTADVLRPPYAGEMQLAAQTPLTTPVR